MERSTNATMLMHSSVTGAGREAEVLQWLEVQAARGGEIVADSATAGATVMPEAVAALRALDGVWREAAAGLGVDVVRGGLDAWVAWDGVGTLHVTPDLDADDTLAQIVLHELSHWMAEGADARGRPDWGLANEDARDHPREVEALRLQWGLCRAHGLERALVPTTVYRALWGVWLAAPEEADVRARRAWGRCPPRAPGLEEAVRRALAETARALRGSSASPVGCGGEREGSG